jgi:hypothetical protein
MGMPRYSERATTALSPRVCKDAMDGWGIPRLLEANGCDQVLPPGASVDAWLLPTNKGDLRRVIIYVHIDRE